jgi:CubicO group peptidase (beta-lactamase class C family)
MQNARQRNYMRNNDIKIKAARLIIILPTGGSTSTAKRGIKNLVSSGINNHKRRRYMFNLIYKNWIALVAFAFVLGGGLTVVKAQPKGFLPCLIVEAPAGNQTALNQKITDKVNQVAHDMLCDAGGGALVIGIIDGNQRQIYTFGETAQGNGQKTTTKTLFEIGSITKTFTGTLLADLVKQNLVEYNNPLQMYVPNGTSVPGANANKITLIELATHTSGLPRDFLSPTYPVPPQLVYNFLDNCVFPFSNNCFDPAKPWLYSNLGFGLLGNALAKADSSPSWEKLVTKEIIEPLGLIDTKVTLTNQEETRRAHGYDINGNPVPWTMPGAPAMNGAGALYSSGDDMMKYLKFNMGLTQNPLNSLLPPAQKNWRSVNGSTTDYSGLGWQIAEGKTRKVWKKGGMVGFLSYIGFCKDKKIGVFVLTNSLKLSAESAGNELYKFLANDPNVPVSIDPDNSN